jgi:hypothetical protein
LLQACPQFLQFCFWVSTQLSNPIVSRIFCNHVIPSVCSHNIDLHLTNSDLFLPYTHFDLETGHYKKYPLKPYLPVSSVNAKLLFSSIIEGDHIGLLEASIIK